MRKIFKIEIKKDNEKKALIKQIEKPNKSTKILLISLITLLILKLYLNIIMFFSDSFSLFYIKNFINNINGILFYLCSYINYSSLAIRLLLLVNMLLLLILILYIENTKKYDVKTKNTKFNLIIKLYLINIYLVITPSINDMMLYHLPNFDNLYFTETSNKVYSLNDLVKLEDYFKDKIIYYSKKLERNNNNEIIYSNNYNDDVLKALHRSSDKISLLSGLYPKKSANINEVGKKILGSNTMGLTHLYNTYFDYDMDPVLILNTMTHEFCHTKGIIRENETVFCSIVAGINSNDEVLEYSAYYEAYLRVLAALRYLNENELYVKYKKVLANLCYDNRFSEICNYYSDNEAYIIDSYELNLTSFPLNKYQHQQDLINALSQLEKYNIKIINLETLEELNVNDVINRLDDDVILSITIKGFNKNVFNEIEKLLSSDLFYEIYQINMEYDVDDEMLNNPVGYYFYPFQDKDEGVFLDFSYSSVKYDYSRVVRLLLEYYEKYGYSI